MQPIVDHESFLTGKSSSFYLKCISDEFISKFCFDPGQDFSRLPRVLGEFGEDYLEKFVQEQDHGSNFEKLLKHAGSHTSEICGGNVLGLALAVHLMLPSVASYTDTVLISLVFFMF